MSTKKPHIRVAPPSRQTAALLGERIFNVFQTHITGRFYRGPRDGFGEHRGTLKAYDIVFQYLMCYLGPRRKRGELPDYYRSKDELANGVKISEWDLISYAKHLAVIWAETSRIISASMGRGDIQYPMIFISSLGCRLAKLMGDSKVLTFPKWDDLWIPGFFEGDLVILPEMRDAIWKWRLKRGHVCTAHELSQRKKRWVDIVPSATRFIHRIGREELLKQYGGIIGTDIILFDDSAMTGFSFAFATEVLIQLGQPKEKIHCIAVVGEYQKL